MKTYTLNKILAVVLLSIGSILPSLAYNNVWVKAEPYPTGAGRVYVSCYSDEEDIIFADECDMKRSTNVAASTCFIWADPAEDYLLAGYARDNGNNKYDNGIDEQVKVRYDGYFTAVYDPTQYGNAGASSQAQKEAEEALEQMTEPTDHIYAVFTQGAVARVAEGQEGRGFVYANKLVSSPGDKVMFSAFGDSNDEEGVKYYRFDHWTDANGENLGTQRFLTVTVQGMDIYYAHFVKTTKDDFKQTETYQPFPDVIEVKGDVNSDGSVDVADISAIITIMAEGAAATGSPGDVNGDGSVDVADISAVISIMADN